MCAVACLRCLQWGSALYSTATLGAAFPWRSRAVARCSRKGRGQHRRPRVRAKQASARQCGVYWTPTRLQLVGLTNLNLQIYSLYIKTPSWFFTLFFIIIILKYCPMLKRVLEKLFKMVPFWSACPNVSTSHNLHDDHQNEKVSLGKYYPWNLHAYSFYYFHESPSCLDWLGFCTMLSHLSSYSHSPLSIMTLSFLLARY